MTFEEEERLENQSQPYDTQMMAISEKVFRGKGKNMGGSKWDKERNTDCILYTGGDNLRLMWRTMGAQNLSKFPSHIMLRHKENVRYKTESQKVMAGHGDYLVYSYCDNEHLIAYKVVDLQIVRDYIRANPDKYGEAYWYKHINSDISGIVVDTNFVPECVIKAITHLTDTDRK